MPLIAQRFCGPASSGNGGYACGLVARELGGDARVTLRTPPPLDRTMTWEHGTGGVRLLDGEVLVAEGEPGRPDEAPAFVPIALAREAAEQFPGDAPHPFPRCFTCGTDRSEGDGLRVFSGPVAEGVVAAPWTPHAHVSAQPVVGVPVTWAAMDCAGSWAAGYPITPAVLGRMTGTVVQAPRVGMEHVVVGEQRGVDGRKIHGATAIYTAHGELLAFSEQTWIAVDPAQFP